MKRYCIKVQENNVIKITPKLPEALIDKVLAIKGVCFIEDKFTNYINVIVDTDFKDKVKLELTYLLK